MSIIELLRDGVDHAGEQRFVEAEKCFRAALEIEPANLIALNGLGVSLHEQGQLDEATHFLSLAVQRAPDFTDAQLNLGLVHLERSNLDRALGCFKEVMRRKPADPYALASTLAGIGTALERKSNFEGAEKYFAKAAQVSNSFGAAKMLRFSAAFLRAIDVIKAPPPLAALVLQSDTEVPVELVTLVTSDPTYLRKYGQALTNSFAHFGNSAHLLHLHIMDPDETIMTEAHSMLTRAGIKGYRVSTEHVTRFAPGTLARAVWYTCARFSHLDAYLRYYRTPMVVLDIDAAIQMPLTKVVEAVNTADLGLFFRQPRRAPWVDIRAAVLVARPTEATHRFLRLLRNYINYFIELGSPKWHLDQCALYCTLRMVEGQSGAPTVRSISDIAEETVFQVGHSYDSRMADPRYARFNSSTIGSV
jgi:tetratricopeptide (TPR) repeat protein